MMRFQDKNIPLNVNYVLLNDLYSLPDQKAQRYQPNQSVLKIMAGYRRAGIFSENKNSSEWLKKLNLVKLN